MLCMKSQLATSKEYIQNRYQMFDFRRIYILPKSNTRSKKFFALRIIFLLSFDSRVHASGCQNLPFEFKRRSPPDIIIRYKQTNGYRYLCWWNRKREMGYFWRNSVHTSHMTLLVRLASTREWVSEIISNYHFWLWLRDSMPKENDLLSRCCHVSSIVGKSALFCAFLNDDSMPKHSWSTWFSFDSQVHASGCQKSRRNYSQRLIWNNLQQPKNVSSWVIIICAGKIENKKRDIFGTIRTSALGTWITHSTREYTSG